jgi:hypothetical protein
MWGVKEERGRNVETVSSSRNGADRGLLIYGRPPVPIRPVDFRLGVEIRSTCAWSPEGMTFDLYRWAPETVNESFQKRKFYKTIWQKV